MLNGLKAWVSTKVQNLANVAGVLRAANSTTQAEGDRTRAAVDHASRSLEEAVRMDVAMALASVQARLAAIDERIARLESLPGSAPGPDDAAFRASVRSGLEWLGGQSGQTLAALGEAERRLAERVADSDARADRAARDLLVLVARLRDSLPSPQVRVETAHPVALTSDDHLHPLGVAQDNTRCARFVGACERLLGVDRPLRALDLGCAGGGMVLEFAMRGHRAVGLEGSDAAARALRAEWRLLERHLFTCDVTSPFRVLGVGPGDPTPPARLAFDVVTAWEVLEHIPERLLPGLFTNIREHLADGGVFAASVATFPCENHATGAVYHVTIKPRDWWLARAAEHGLAPSDAAFVTADFARGSGNGPSWQDWDARTRPDLGFHLVLRRA